jgi:cytoskeletal protein CcmA (bactofilin family)
LRALKRGDVGRPYAEFMTLHRWIAFAALLAFATVAAAAEDHFVFGGTLRIEQPVAGDLIAAGGNIDVESAVSGDAVLAGGNLRLAGPVGQNVYAAGGRLAIDAAVGRNLRVAGGQVELGPKSSVAGNVTVGGGQVQLRGAVKGTLRVSGGRVTLDAPVDGDVVATAGQLKLGPNARIGGALRWRSGEDLDRDPAAQIAGTVERLPMPVRRDGDMQPGPQRVRGGAGWLWTLGLMLLATVMVAATPLASRRMAQVWHERFGWSVLWGFIALVCVPVAALILLVSVIGMPLGLLVMLLYGALLIAGYAASGVALGQWALARWRPPAAERIGWRIAAGLAALAVLALLGRLPWIGGLVALVAMLAGIGALLQLLLQPKAAAAAA